jgi:hypothetical protein
MRNRGWRGTFAPQMRMAKTFWVPGRRDYYYVAGGMGFDGTFNRLAQQEYLWNTDRPDASDQFKTFTRLYEKGGEVTEFQRERLIPRVARILYGEKNAPAIAEAVAANVSFNYVQDPEAVGSMDFDAEKLDDPYKYMDDQAEKMEWIAAACRPLVESGEADAMVRRYYRNAGLCSVMARLKAATVKAQRLAEAGQTAEAAELARATLDELPAMEREVEEIRRLAGSQREDDDRGRRRSRRGRGGGLDDFQPTDFKADLETLAAAN